MGALNDRNHSSVLDGLYGVQLGRPLQQSPQSEDEALRTTPAVESSTCERQRLLIRRLWQHRPSCLKPIHRTITCCEMMLQEELEHRYLRVFAGWGRNSFELVSFFQRKNPKVSAVGRLHYDRYHHTGNSSYPCTEDNYDC
ncbi:hypothetical protein BAE44_0022683 [Dichanthelium oligosanthes]|uniref:Uncharacterized protein n=1 Tax=Dichanthelium oligosanthes TaxID=888268 RepID=A0A1E5UU04_9POAL|nr:hypothetical protein BAE44_0022683 [Dichanthelium oligosanthes]